MAGRIREEDIAEVREKARIDDIVSQYVTLKNAGGGSQKGLCPFHDEKSPSFNVNPARGFYHCAVDAVLDLGRPRRSGLAGGTHRVLGAAATGWMRRSSRTACSGCTGSSSLATASARSCSHDGHRWFVRSGEDQKKRREVLTTT